MKDWTFVDVLTTALLGLSVLLGAAYGASGGGTLLSVVAGAAVFGCFGLLLVSVVGLALGAAARFLGRRRQ